MVADEPNDKDQAHEPEVLEASPMLQRLLGQSFHSSFEGPGHLLPLTKVNESHITQMLTLQGDEERRAHDRHIFDRKIYLGLLAGILLFFGFLVVWLADRNPELLKEIVKTFVTFAAGALAGAGGLSLAQKKKKDADED